MYDISGSCREIIIIYFVGPHGHSSEVTSLDVHKNDKVFVSGGSDSLVKLLHADTGQVRS